MSSIGTSTATAPAAAPAAAAEPEPQQRKLYRSSDGRLVAGVARGLGDHLGIDPLYVRMAFIVLVAANGAGLLAYGLFWVFAPQNPYETERRRERGRDVATLVAVGALTIGICLALPAIGLGSNPGLVVPLVVVGVGVAILWRQADDASRTRWRQVAGTSRLSGALRIVGGIALVLVGSIAILVGSVDVGDATGGLVAALVVVAGLALVTGPWWLRMARDLSAERNARIREQERAEVAAHVHDSVLHTLTLIQRHVDDPREVARLARAQERDLRTWLYRPVADADARIESALAAAAAEVEDAHGVTVEVVVVGDCPLDDSLRALLLAAREAMVNAAKYAGDFPISLYAEVQPDRVTLFVRDRGDGFEPADVPEDRLGLRQSVIGRMERHGGTAVVHSASGEGTEIQLEMPRSTQ